jgi:hypothetical protein
MYYSGGERGARRLAIIVHKGEVRSVIKKFVCNHRCYFKGMGDN